MIKKTVLFFLCFMLLAMPGCKKKLPTQPDIPAEVLPTIIHFTASPESIMEGEMSILSWNVSHSTAVQIDHGIGTVSAIGTIEIFPEATTTYTLTATNLDGQKTQACTIEVNLMVEFITVISSSDLLYIGISETFTATATMSDGSTKAVIGGVWSEDNPNVALVATTTGEVMIVGSGMVNIFVDYEGQRGTKAIRGLPNYQGTWTGSYSIITCDAEGDFLSADFCSYFSPGVVAPLDLVLTQTQDQVIGRFYLNLLSADTVGPIQIDGQLLLTGLVTSDPFTIDVMMQLQSATPGQITGGMVQLHLGSGWSGNALLLCEISDLTRTSTMAMAQPKRHVMTPTLQDLMRALIRR